MTQRHIDSSAPNVLIHTWLAAEDAEAGEDCLRAAAGELVPAHDNIMIMMV